MGDSGNKKTTAHHTGDCAFIRCHIAQDPVIDPYIFYITTPEDGTVRELKHVESEFYR